MKLPRDDDGAKCIWEHRATHRRVCVIASDEDRIVCRSVEGMANAPNETWAVEDFVSEFMVEVEP